MLSGPVAYLDHAATTPMRVEAVEAMLPFLRDNFANPSGSHRASRLARQAVDEARDVVADVLGANPGEIVFTGGGTESDNAAIVGAVRSRGGTAVCPATEHHAVLHAVERCGGSIVTVDASGSVDLDHLRHMLDALVDVAVVSVMVVNNEVGTITDIATVAEVVRAHAPVALLHTDAIQAACWIDIRGVTPHVDLLSLSAHKFGGPKGVGILFTRTGTSIEPLIVGGGQERDRRSGTHNVAGIVSTAAALAATDRDRAAELGRVGELRACLVDTIVAAADGVHETVARDRAVPGVVHLCIDGVESEALLYLLDEAGVYASAASACASGAIEASHVLTAMGVAPARARGALRLSMGHASSTRDVGRAAEAVTAAIRRLRTSTARAGR